MKLDKMIKLNDLNNSQLKDIMNKIKDEVDRSRADEKDEESGIKQSLYNSLSSSVKQVL